MSHTIALIAPVLLIVSTDGGAAAELTVTAAGRDPLTAVQVIGPNSRFAEDPTRYEQDPHRNDRKLLNPVKATRASYLEFIDKDSTYGAEAIARNPDRQQYGVRHAFPALAQYAASGDERYARAIKQSLKFYDAAIRKQVAKAGWHEAYMHDPTLLCLYRQVFQQHNAWIAADEAWFEEFFLWLNRTVHVWGGPEHFWRGPMHRATGEGIMKLLAATLYPDAPEAPQWRRYAEIQWNDWWKFRDNSINDINYFHGQIFPMILGAHLLGRSEVFTDPQMRRFWDRLVEMTTPDGAVVPFGPAWGWNSHAGERLMALEVAARYTGDGRYRFAAQRLFQYLLYQHDVLRTNHMLDHFSQLGVAVAYFLADDKLPPLPPSPASSVLYHKEVLRVKGKPGAQGYLESLDPDPLKAHIDCNLLCTEKTLPFKLCLRSGWNPGNLYMLVDLFPRHEPMNPAGVLGMTYGGSVLTHAIDSKGLTDWLNMFRVDDLSGTATVVTNPNPKTVDAYYMDVSVPCFADYPAATFARVRVEDYNGYPMTLEREFFFVKNRFCLVRDTAVFRESFLARLGPNWVTQNVGPQVGDHWANTYVGRPLAFERPLHSPPMDLLVYHAPHAGRRLIVSDETADVRRLKLPFTVRYVWQGIVQPQRKYCFAHLLMPGLPTRQPVRSNQPGAASLAEILGQYMAAGVSVPADDEEQSVWRVRTEKDREEWVVFNGGGKAIRTGALETDARQVYLDVRQDKILRALAVDGSYLTLGGHEAFRQPQRKVWQQQ